MVCRVSVFVCLSGVLVGYHELVVVNLHLCVVPMSIVTCLEEGILQLSSTARERNAGQCVLHEAPCCRQT